MKTMQEITAAIKEAAGMGAENVYIYNDEVAKCIITYRKIITEHSIKAIAGENPYTIIPTNFRQYGNTYHMLMLSIYY